jgi:flagellar hook protein FlgE
MMRSLYAGVSGLKNHQVRMDVLGNNIANVNTNGFKKGRVTFQDMLSQTLAGAARPETEKGGVNPQQVGLGMMVASIDTIHTNGSLQTTGKNTDLAIMGEGFFINKKGDETFYTRAGNFNIDRDGLLVNPANGYKVQGWQSVLGGGGEYMINTSASIGDLTIPIGSKDPARATRNIDFKCNLNSLTPIIAPSAELSPDFEFRNTHSAEALVYDSYGEAHKMTVRFTRQGVNIWRAQFDIASASNITTNAPGPRQNDTNILYLTFNRNGTIASVGNDQPEASPVDLVEGMELNANVFFRLPDGSDNTIQLNFGTAGLVDGVTQFDQKSTTKSVFQDGYGMGYMQAFNIDDSGAITGVYTNGQKRLIGQVALATFTNPGGLEKVGSNNYVESNNSGSARISAALTEDKGSIRSGSLEMSNVDLSEEFTDMIVTQRGFQANSRTIQTTDQMLQEVLTLKR